MQEEQPPRSKGGSEAAVDSEERLRGLPGGEVATFFGGKKWEGARPLGPLPIYRTGVGSRSQKRWRCVGGRAGRANATLVDTQNARSRGILNVAEPSLRSPTSNGCPWFVYVTSHFAAWVSSLSCKVVLNHFGNPASSVIKPRPVALRPSLATGLPVR